MDLRIGQGFDVHAFAPQRDLILCGEKIPAPLGLAGHSDADVALHAVMDAILGALALGDIGEHFSDRDEKWRGADSRELLKRVLALPRIAAGKLLNCDLTIVAQAPKLSPFREKMRQNLAQALNLDLERVSVKFTTTEKLGFTGRGEGIAATAVVLIDAEK